jgi:NAD(P)H dehydrogenase (quinone)
VLLTLTEFGTVAVTGATGTVGRELVRRLIDRGATVRALVRRPDAVVPGAETVLADLDDPRTLPAAFAGADQLFLNAAGAAVVDGEQPMVAQQKAAIDAAITAGVNHIVKISVQGAVDDGPLATGAHAAIERHLARSGVLATVLQPNGFLQNLLTGVSTFTPEGDLVDPYDGGAIAYIDAADIAACAAELLIRDTHRGEVHVLTGPRAITHTDIAAAVSRVVGRSIGVVPVTPDELAGTLVARGLTTSFAQSVAELSRQAAAGDLAATTRAVHTLTGQDPNDVETFADQHAEQLRAVVPGR